MDEQDELKEIQDLYGLPVLGAYGTEDIGTEQQSEEGPPTVSLVGGTRPPTPQPYVYRRHFERGEQELPVFGPETADLVARATYLGADAGLDIVEAVESAIAQGWTPSALKEYEETGETTREVGADRTKEVAQLITDASPSSYALSLASKGEQLDFPTQAKDFLPNFREPIMSFKGSFNRVANKYIQDTLASLSYKTKMNFAVPEFRIGNQKVRAWIPALKKVIAQNPLDRDWEVYLGYTC